MKKKTNKNKLTHLLDESRGFLTEREVKLLRHQIRANSFAIDHYIEVIDLLINKERCPKDANTLAFLRQRLSVSIAENDTFRKVLWHHTQLAQREISYDGDSEAAAFLLNQIKSRKQAMVAQMARK
ncbi:MAG: hypothetical protein HY583_01740 [Candidatus Omnitrophica bacterium]|nr:hypothetical protein [Candidatus Omnitrophota bacterium]